VTNPRTAGLATSLPWLYPPLRVLVRHDVVDPARHPYRIKLDLQQVGQERGRVQAAAGDAKNNLGLKRRDGSR